MQEGVSTYDTDSNSAQLRDIYLHPNSAYRVFSLSDEQIDQFITFCLDDANSVPFPCPMEAGWAAHRIFPEDTFDLHIFRDKFERIQKPPVPHPEGITVHPRRPLLDDNPDAIMLRQKVQELDRENDARRANGDW